MNLSTRQLIVSHETYIKRCLQIAENGIGLTRPNPSVGALIVYKNNIIGEGYTSAYGGNHAEVNAINSVKQKELLEASTLYVSLEPCTHFGKTPPCTDLIIKNKIKKVVIGCKDPSEQVSGKGIISLKKAGIEVEIGILESECIEQNIRFFTFHKKNRPYIILKWAETSDGFISPSKRTEQKSFWISNDYSRQLSHKWRSEEQAILVGTRTVIDDNPRLNIRNWSGNNPVRIVLDRTLKISKTLNIYDGSARTIIITAQDISSNSDNIKFETINFSKNIAVQICKVLYNHKIQSLIVEGGLRTLQTFIDLGLWDEARVFFSEVKFQSGIKSPVIKGNIIKQINIEKDVLKIIKK